MKDSSEEESPDCFLSHIEYDSGLFHRIELWDEPMLRIYHFIYHTFCSVSGQKSHWLTSRGQKKDPGKGIVFISLVRGSVSVVLCYFMVCYLLAAEASQQKKGDVLGRAVFSSAFDCW